jgi:hypothetical protein
MNTPIVLFQNVLVNITVPNPSNKLFLPDQPNLRNARIVGIEFHDIQLLPIVSDMITPNVPLDVFRNSFLTLVTGRRNAVERIPVQNFQSILNNDNNALTPGRVNTYFRDLANLPIYFNKSYIEFPNALNILIGQNCAFNMGVYYMDAVGAN